MSRKIVQFLMLAALVAVTSIAMADPPARVGRVTVTEGRVTMLVNGEEETGNLMNWPVTTENHLTTAPGARAEFRVGSSAIRLDGDSDIEVEQLDDERLRLRLNYGTASVRVRDPAMLNEFEFITPQARITLAEPGSFRVDTERAPDTTVVNVFGGMARVEGAGTMLTARAGKRVEVRGDEVFSALAVRDRFDDWVTNRDRREEGLVASRYVPADMTGYEDLDQYGNWVEDREYGTIWFPRAVPIGWAPYRDGRWVWISPWGWTWVDNSPWGYAPFHYGRWVVVSGRWCWAPGRYYGRPVWSPALVGWVGGSNWSVSFGTGRAGPAVGWYPLTPRDRYVPGYRISADYERRLVWNHRSNERWHERYPERFNDGRREGVTALPREQFDQGRRISVTNVARVTPQEVRNIPQMATPPQLTAGQVRPQRPEWRQERDSRGDREDRGNRGVDRRIERGPEQRGPELRGPDRVGRDERQEQPRQLQQLQAVPQVQQPPQQRSNVIRTDNEDREMWRGQRNEQRRSVTATNPQPQLQAAPPQRMEQPQRFEQPRNDPRVEQRAEPRHEPQPRMEQPRMEQRAEQRPEPRFEPRENREDRGRHEAPQQVQRQAPPPMQAQPQPQPQPQQQQRNERRERAQERRDDNQNDRFR